MYPSPLIAPARRYFVTYTNAVFSAVQVSKGTKPARVPLIKFRYGINKHNSPHGHAHPYKAEANGFVVKDSGSGSANVAKVAAEVPQTGKGVMDAPLAASILNSKKPTIRIQAALPRSKMSPDEMESIMLGGARK